MIFKLFLNDLNSFLSEIYEKNNLFNPMNVISFSGMIDKIKKARGQRLNRDK